MCPKGFVSSVFLVLPLVVYAMAGPTSARAARGGVLNQCKVDINNVTFSLLLNCVREKSLSFLDIVADNDSIDVLADGSVRLVRRKGDMGPSENSESTLKALSNSSWANSVLHKFSRLLRTHVVQIDVASSGQEKVAESFRGRRRRNQMAVPAMLFGLIAIGMIMVPIGFQFLSMFAGKAVLLSKLALMLASVNGLRRLAASGLHYGFYTAPEPHLPPPPLPHLMHPRPVWERSDQPRTI